MSAPKRKAPAPSKEQGANGEQLSFLPRAELSPAMPSAYSKAWLALLDMTHGPLTQIDWLRMRRGWRLSAAFKELDYLGWPVDSEWVLAEGCPNPIKRYYLLPEGLSIAGDRLKGGAA